MWTFFVCLFWIRLRYINKLIWEALTDVWFNTKDSFENFFTTIGPLFKEKFFWNLGMGFKLKIDQMMNVGNNWKEGTFSWTEHVASWEVISLLSMYSINTMFLEILISLTRNRPVLSNVVQNFWTYYSRVDNFLV